MFEFYTRLTALDWSVILAYLVLMLIVGLSVSKRAGKSISDFFVSGQRLPWYLAGGPAVGFIYGVVFIVTLVVSVRLINRQFAKE